MREKGRSGTVWTIVGSRPLIFLCAVVSVALAVALTTASCGGNAVSQESDAPGSTLTTVNGESAGTDIQSLFAELAQELSPLKIYGLETLPVGVHVADSWRPVIEEGAPDGQGAGSVPNPRVIGEGSSEPEVQLVLQWGEGWAVILENFRGDVGDTPGTAVGQVEGHEARRYEINGGTLVQWGDEGRWYGIFGRGVPADKIADLALQMGVVEY